MLQALKRIFKNNGFVAQTIIVGSVILAVSILGGLAFSGANKVSAQGTPTITVTYPNGGESLQQGQIVPITWSSANMGSLNARISLFDPNFHFTNIASTTGNTGSYNWTIPLNFPNGSYGIQVSSDDKNQTAMDLSDSDFTIGAPPTPSTSITITVLSPNGGESFQQGQTIPITWSSANMGSLTVSIDLLNNDGRIIEARVSVAPNTGSYNFLIPTDLPNGNYKILVSSNDVGTSASDQSNNYFTIFTSQAQVTCTDSDGGDNPETPGYAVLSNSSVQISAQTDYCYLENNGNRLNEAICDGNKTKTISHICPNGCRTTYPFISDPLMSKSGSKMPLGACITSTSPYIEIFTYGSTMSGAFNSNDRIDWMLDRGGMYAIKWQNVSADAYPLNLNLINNDTGDKSVIINSLSLDSSGQANYMWPVPNDLANGSYKLELVGSNSLDIKSDNITIQGTAQEATPQNTGIIQQTETVVTAPAVCTDVTIKAVINAVGGCTEIDSSRFPNISKNCCGSAAVSVPPPTDIQPSTVCSAIAKSIVSSVGGCTEIDASKFPNVAKSCCTSVSVTTVTKETLLKMLDDSLADGVISDVEKTALLTALNSYLQ